MHWFTPWHPCLARLPTTVDSLIRSAKTGDIATTRTVASFKCPVSQRRATLPCRGEVCSHLQCFDGFSYLQVRRNCAWGSGYVVSDHVIV